MSGKERDRSSEVVSKVELGTGWFQWPSKERRSNRYGTIRLFKFDPHENDTSFIDFPPEIPLGEYGHIVAEVIETQESSHIGDLARGLYPETPEIGEKMIVGEGILFVEVDEWSPVVGLRPVEERNCDWLNPEILYRLHDQRVNLTFEELKKPAI